MLIATCLVAVLPPALALALRAYGVLSSPWLSMALAVAMSLIVSSAGSAYWRKRQNGGDAVFSELLLWGWIRRRLQDRKLANAIELLDLADARGVSDPSLSFDQRERLLRQLAEALEGRDVYLGGHSRRVARHAAMIARGLGLPAEDVARIRAAAAIHDVGKLRTPKTILNKRSRLTDAEFDVIKRHPVDGADLVAALGDPVLTGIVRHHHERLDGRGYPDGLTGDAIPLGSRIIAVADTFDAITSARPYRAASPHQRAIDVLRTEAGSQLDPGAVRAFLDYYSGRRPTVVFALAIAGVRRVVSWLSGDPAAAATVSASKVAAATAATAVIAVSAGAPVGTVVKNATHDGARKAPARAVLAAVHSEVLRSTPTPAPTSAPAPAPRRLPPAHRTAARHPAPRRSAARRPKPHPHPRAPGASVRRATPAPPVRSPAPSPGISIAAAQPAVPAAPPRSSVAKSRPPAHHAPRPASKPAPAVVPNPPASGPSNAASQVSAPAVGATSQAGQDNQGDQGNQSGDSQDNQGGDSQDNQGGDSQGASNQDGAQSHSQHDGNGDGGGPSGSGDSGAVAQRSGRR